MSTHDLPDERTADAVLSGRGEVPERWRATTGALADLRDHAESTAPAPSAALASLLTKGGAEQASTAPTTTRSQPVRRFVTRSLTTLGITAKLALAGGVAAAAVGGAVVVQNQAPDVAAVEVSDEGIEPELPEEAAPRAGEALAADEDGSSDDADEGLLDADDLSDADDEADGPAEEASEVAKAVAAFKADTELEGCAFGQGVAAIASGKEKKSPEDCEAVEDDEESLEALEEDESTESVEDEESDDADSEDDADSGEDDADSDEDDADGPPAGVNPPGLDAGDED